MTQLAKPGWLTAPKGKKPPKEGTPFHFILTRSADLPKRPEPEMERSAFPHAYTPNALREWREWATVSRWDEKLPERATWGALSSLVTTTPDPPEAPLQEEELPPPSMNSPEAQFVALLRQLVNG